MTKTEKEAFVQWNKSITAEHDKTMMAAEEIESKYMRINGTRSCNPETFILEIATTTEVDEEERIQDIRIIIDYMKGRAKWDALIDILHR